MWTFILGLLGPGRAIALGLTAAFFVLSTSGMYVKGRMDCAAIHETASLKLKIADLEKAKADLEAAMALGEALAKEIEEIEKTNDETEKGQPPVGDGDGCADPGFLRWLDTLR